MAWMAFRCSVFTSVSVSIPRVLEWPWLGWYGVQLFMSTGGHPGPADAPAPFSGRLLSSRVPLKQHFWLEMVVFYHIRDQALLTGEC